MTSLTRRDLTAIYALADYERALAGHAVAHAAVVRVRADYVAGRASLADAKVALHAAWAWLAVRNEAAWAVEEAAVLADPAWRPCTPPEGYERW